MFTNRMKLSAVTLFAVLFLLSGSYSEGQDFSSVQVEAIKVPGNVYMLTGAGGNIGISAGKDCVFMIDASYAPLTEKIKAAIGTFSPKPTKFVVTTHWHQDHTGGNENLSREGAIMVAHENVRKRLGSEQFVGFFNRKIPPMAESALPIITFSQDISFHLNGDDIFIFHVAPAHTDGDAIVIANEIKAGKTLDEVIASKPTRDFDPIWGKGFLKPEQFVKIVYDSLVKKK